VDTTNKGIPFFPKRMASGKLLEIKGKAEIIMTSMQSSFMQQNQWQHSGETKKTFSDAESKNKVPSPLLGTMCDDVILFWL
jgi:hypothetical protein